MNKMENKKIPYYQSCFKYPVEKNVKRGKISTTNMTAHFNCLVHALLRKVADAKPILWATNIPSLL